jgi:hypothetical protein
MQSLEDERVSLIAFIVGDNAAGDFVFGDAVK